jgi:FAD/FMN-containing dehydrogenase
MLSKVKQQLNSNEKVNVFGVSVPTSTALIAASGAAVVATGMLVKYLFFKSKKSTEKPLKSEFKIVKDPKTGEVTSVTVRNWFGNISFSPSKLVVPESRDDVLKTVQDAVRTGQRVRAVGALHSWSESIEAQDAICVAMGNLNKVLSIDHEKKLVKFEAGITYRQLFEAIDKEGLALNVIPNHETLTFGGALCNAAHGTSKNHGTMCNMVEEMELVVSRNGGEVITLRRSAPAGSEELHLFQTAVASIGNVGIIYSITIRAVEKYHCVTYVACIPNENAFLNPQKVTSSHDSALLFLNAFYPCSIAKLQFRISPIVSKAVKRPWLHDISLDYVLYHFKPGSKKFFKTMIGYIVAGVFFRLMGPQFFSTCYVMSWLDGETLKSFKDRSLLNMEYAIPLERINETVEELIKLYKTYQAQGYKRRAGIGLRAVAADEYGYMSPTKNRATVYVDMPYQQMDELELDFFKNAEKIFISKDGRASWSRRFSSSGPEVLHNYPEAELYMRGVEELDPSGTFINAYQTRIFGHLDQRVRSTR